MARENAENQCVVARICQGTRGVVCAGVAALFALPAPALAADISRSHTIACRVTEGRGATSFGRSKHLGEAAGTQRFAHWVFASEGLNMRDRIDLFWTPSARQNRLLRVAIDGPVSKPAMLISATDDTLVAVAHTSDQYTTRSWLITINFQHELVMVVASASGAVAVKGQVMVLSCRFKGPGSAQAEKSAADTWRR